MALAEDSARAGRGLCCLALAARARASSKELAVAAGQSPPGKALQILRLPML